jgi:hypothetical protein
VASEELTAIRAVMVELEAELARDGIDVPDVPPTPTELKNRVRSTDPPSSLEAVIRSEESMSATYCRKIALHLVAKFPGHTGNWYDEEFARRLRRHGWRPNNTPENMRKSLDNLRNDRDTVAWAVVHNGKKLQSAPDKWAEPKMRMLGLTDEEQSKLIEDDNSPYCITWFLLGSQEDEFLLTERGQFLLAKFEEKAAAGKLRKIPYDDQGNVLTGDALQAEIDGATTKARRRVLEDIQMEQQGRVRIKCKKCKVVSIVDCPPCHGSCGSRLSGAIANRHELMLLREAAIRNYLNGQQPD